MDTKKYEAFEKTVELQSLTKAAQELGLTQSGVSHMLSAIEAELQLPLLKRTRTGARLTPEGEQMMPYIHEIVRQERLLRQAAERLHTLVTGKIRIGTFTSVATHWLPAMMMQFQKEHPQVDFQLFNGDYHDIDTWLGDGSVDLAFTTLPARPGCRCTPLYEDALAAAGCLTYGTNVKEVTTQVSEATVDCGIIYCTDAFSAGLSIVDYATAEMCGQVIYPAAVLNVSKNVETAQAFLDFCRTPDAAAVFESVGFSAAE